MQRHGNICLLLSSVSFVGTRRANNTRAKKARRLPSWWQAFCTVAMRCHAMPCKQRSYVVGCALGIIVLFPLQFTAVPESERW